MPSLPPGPWEAFLREQWRITDEADLRWVLAHPLFDRFAGAAKRAGSGWHYREFASGHEAMITAPDDVAALLLELV